MDNFMEKITHQFDSTDLIRANAQADAAELENTKEQLVLFESHMEKVDGALSDLRQVNLKNIETAEELNNLARQSGERIGAEADKLGATSERIDETAQKLGLSTVRLGESADKLGEATDKLEEAFGSVKDESLSKIKETSEISIAGINKTIDESLAKIAEIQDTADATAAIGESVGALSEKLDTLYKQLEEYMHTDHVKIYRNVQASVVEELSKQTEEIKNSTKHKSAATPLMIVNLVVSLLTLAMIILSYLGIL